MPFYCGVYLAGDSYPKDIHIEAAIQSRIARLFSHWYGQRDFIDRCAGERQDFSLAGRMAALHDLFPKMQTVQQTVLFGRSSGGRIATVFAASKPVKAVICFGYPFRYPNHPDEPQRYQHLAGIDVPILIFQGKADVYGGVSVAQEYQLSNRVIVEFLDCDHEFRVDEAIWDRVAERIFLFLAPLLWPCGPNGSASP